MGTKVRDYDCNFYDPASKPCVALYFPPIMEVWALGESICLVVI